MGTHEIDSLWPKLYPLVIRAVDTKLAGAAAGGGSLSHTLNGPLHSGTLDDSQAPQFLKLDGTRTLLGNLAVGTGITVDGVDISAFKLLYDAHILNPDAHHAGFVALKDTAGIVVSPDAADRITISGSGGVSSVGGTNVIALALALQTNSGLSINGAGQVAVGQGAGLTVGASTVALTTPGSLSVGSTNTATGSHTHAVTSSSAPGATAALLATTAAGKLTLQDLGIVSAIDWATDTYLTRAAAGRLRLAGNLAGNNPAALNVMGAMAVGVDGTPAAQLVSQASSEQLRLAYSAATYASATVNNGGTLALKAPGEIVVDLGGRSIKPIRPYETNLGSLTNKWLSIYAAELWVESLVAQDVIGTIGGRILVAPTTTLTAPAAVADSAITVKHNSHAINDTLYAESNGAVEFVRVTGLVSNPIRNSSFEDALATYWTSYGSPTLAQVSTAEAVAGAQLLRVAAGAAVGGVRQEITGLTVGATYTLSVRARALPGTVASVTVRLSEGGGSVAPVVTTATVEPTWQTLVVSKVAPASGSLRVWVEVAAGASAEVDAALLNSGATADPVFYGHYSDGGTGGYRLSVTRDLDGSGANAWPAGTAFVNTGQAGSGFMDLYSISGITAIPFSFIFNMKTNGATPWEAGTFSLNQATDTTWEWFENGTAAIGDAVYIGVANSTFAALTASLAVGMATTGTLVWEYWNGTAWAAFTPTAVIGALTAAGRYSHSIPTLAGWAAKTINGASAYWVRYRYSVAGTLTTRARTNVRAARERATYGPTIVGNVRQSTTYNDWAPHWAIGNLNGLYDYGADVYGAALGKYSAATAWLGADATNGLRMMRGTTPRLTLDSSGTIRQGEDVSAAATTRFLLVGANGSYGEAAETLGVGDLMLGRNGASQGNMLYDQSEGRLKFRGATTTQLYIDTDGSLTWGGGVGKMNAAGIEITPGTTVIAPGGSPTAFTWKLGAATYGEIYAYVPSFAGSTASLWIAARNPLGSGRTAPVLYLRAEPGDGAYGGESSVAALTLQGGRNMGGVLVGASCWIDATTIQLGSSGISSLIDLQAAETVAQGALVANGALTANSTLTVGDGVGAEVLAVNGGAGQVRDLRFNTAGSLRWIVRAENTAESGGNVGSNFAIVARDDSGNDLGAMLTLTRSDGAVVLGRSGGKHGFYGGAAVAKPTVSGSRGGNAALASLLTALDSLKLITNSTTA